MLVHDVYINGLVCISAQHSFDDTFIAGKIEPMLSDFRKAIDPDYKQYLNPTASRRLSRFLKMSLVAAQKCVAKSGIAMPEAIITGTGLGCLEDTEKFLISIIQNNESLLSPTSFIQSTHNTISGQIAMMLSCNHPNYTYSNRYFSFESSLLDGLLMLHDNSANSVMVNAADELPVSIHHITKKLGLWDRNESIMNKPLFGVTAGEGVVSMMLSQQKSNATARLKAFNLAYQLPEGVSIEQFILDFLLECEIKSEEVDVLLLGMNGEKESDHYYMQAVAEFSRSSVAVYKHLFGEMFTSSAFSYWLASEILSKKTIPLSCLIIDKGHTHFKHILIYNQFRGKYHSLCLLSDVEI